MWCDKLQSQSAGPDAVLPHSVRIPVPKQEAGQADLLSLLFGMNQNAILKDVKENTKSIAARLAIMGVMRVQLRAWLRGVDAIEGAL